MSARLVHHIEYAVLALLLVGAAIWERDAVTAWFWFFLLAPDLFGLLPAFLFGRAPAKGYLPPRGVWLYNSWHTFTLPLVACIAVALVGGSPWPILGWLLHISADRAIGYGLRGADGGQALI